MHRISSTGSGTPPSKERIHRLWRNWGLSTHQPWQIERLQQQNVPKCWMFSLFCLLGLFIYIYLNEVQCFGKVASIIRFYTENPYQALSQMDCPLSKYQAHTPVEHTFRILPAKPCHWVWKTGKNKPFPPRCWNISQHFTSSKLGLGMQLCKYINVYIIIIIIIIIIIRIIIITIIYVYVYCIRIVRQGSIRFS